MVAPAGQAHEAHVALEHDGLGLARDAVQAEPRGQLALVHDAVADEVRVLDVVDDERAEIARIGERAAHHLRVGDGARAVREGDRAGLAQEPDLGHLAAREPLGQGRRRAHVDDRRVAGAAQHEVDDGRDRRATGLVSGMDTIVVTPPAAAAALALLQGLAVLGAGLADEGAHVDEAGREDLARAVDHLGVGGVGRCGPTSAIESVAHQHGAALLAAGGGIDEARVREEERLHWLSPSLGSAGGSPAPRAPPCARRRPSRPARGSATARRRRPRRRSRRRGSSGPDASRARRAWRRRASPGRGRRSGNTPSRTARRSRSCARAEGAASSRCRRPRAPGACP